jgi:cytochrome c553
MAVRTGHRAALTMAAVAMAAALLPARLLADEAPPAGDAGRGARIAYTCLGCHGIADYRNAYPGYHVPKLGGQHAPYLVAALTEYRSGDRPHKTMHAQAMSLTDQDLRDIAAYFATGKAITGGKPHGMPAVAQVCTSCHGADGIGISPDYPTLAGQQSDYLETALKAYRFGARKNPIMGGFAAPLKDEDIHAIAEYFSRQTPGLTVPATPSAPGSP